MKTVWIVNPAAGGRDISHEFSRQLASAAAEAGISRDDYVITRTTHAGHARDLAESYASSGEPVRLIAVGGDGTLNEVFRGAYQYKNAAVGCVPYGSGNDFLRNFGTKEEFLDLADQFHGGETDIDLFQTEFGIGATICSAGLDAQIAYDIPRFRRLPLCGGEGAYRVSILKNILGPLGRTLQVTADHQTIQQDCLLTAVCNGSYYGGGFQAGPDAVMDDGLLDVMLVKKVPLHRIVRILPAYQKGKHMKNGKVHPKLQDAIRFLRCKRIRIKLADDRPEPMIITIDGECHPTRELTVELLPLAGRVLLPGKVHARLKRHAAP